VSKDTHAWSEFAVFNPSLLKVDSICLLKRGNMTMKAKIVAVFLMCAAYITALGPDAGFSSRADDLATAVYNGANQLRGTCGTLADDPRLTVAAQRQANDMARNGVAGGHIGSDGSSPLRRIADAGYFRPGSTGEIIYWGTGSLANPTAALNWWMASPAHRATILNCGFTASGFATAWDGNKMIVVGDFATP
jgi:uncharacterized protein YkwD